MLYIYLINTFESQNGKLINHSRNASAIPVVGNQISVRFLFQICPKAASANSKWWDRSRLAWRIKLWPVAKCKLSFWPITTCNTWRIALSGELQPIVAEYLVAAHFYYNIHFGNWFLKNLFSARITIIHQRQRHSYIFLAFKGKISDSFDSSNNNNCNLSRC